MDENFQRIWDLEKRDNDFNFSSINSVPSFEWELGPIKHNLVSDVVLPDNNDVGDTPGYHWNDELEPVEAVLNELGKVSPKDAPEYHQNNNFEPVEALQVASEKASSKSDTPEYHQNDNHEPVEAVPDESGKVGARSVRSNKRSETRSSAKKSSTMKEGSKRKKRGGSNKRRRCNCSTSVAMDDLKKFSESLIDDLKVESENMLANFREDLKKLAGASSTKKDKHRMDTGQAQQMNITASEPQLEQQRNDLSVRNCSWPARLAINDTGPAANSTGLAANVTGPAANITGLAANRRGLAANVAVLADNGTSLATNGRGLSANGTGLAANVTVLTANGTAANSSGLATNSRGLSANCTGLAANVTVLTANGAAANSSGLAAHVTGLTANVTLNYARQSSAMDAINNHGYISNIQGQVPHPNLAQTGSSSSYLYQHSIQTSSMGSVFPLLLHQRLNSFSNNPSQIVTNNSVSRSAMAWRINGGPTRSSASSHVLSNNVAANNSRSHVPFRANGALYQMHDPRYGNFH